MKYAQLYSKFLLILIFTFLLFKTTFSQKQNPPGTILLKEHIYIDQVPICNVHIREYEYSMKNFLHFNLDTLEIFVNNLPYYNYDMSNFFHQTKFSYNKNSLQYLINDTAKFFNNNWVKFKSYFNLPEFNYYPIVNISANNAAAFCRWRTLMVKMLYAAQPKEKSRKKFYDNFEYRLPTYEELELATIKFTNIKKLMTLNKNQNDSLCNVIIKRKNNNNFYISNLNEICAINTKYATTNWNTSTFFINKYNTIMKDEIVETIGFRCVCEIKN